MRDFLDRSNSEDASGALRADNPGTGNILNEYTVEETDTLEEIGRKHNMSWQQIADANKDVLNDPDFIKPGFKLKIPNLRNL